jgi:hypothetical protein
MRERQISLAPTKEEPTSETWLTSHWREETRLKTSRRLTLVGSRCAGVFPAKRFLLIVFVVLLIGLANSKSARWYSGLDSTEGQGDFISNRDLQKLHALIEKFGKNDHAFYSEKEGCRNFVLSLVYYNLRHLGCGRATICCKITIDPIWPNPEPRKSILPLHRPRLCSYGLRCRAPLFANCIQQLDGENGFAAITPGGRHVKRLKDALGEYLLIRLSTGLLDDETKQIVAGIAVTGL